MCEQVRLTIMIQKLTTAAIRSASEASNFRRVILNHNRKVKMASVKAQSIMAVVASVVPLYSIRTIAAYTR
jgi:hypothetical protein